MSPSRRNLLIVLSIFWLLIAWLIASLRPGADGIVIIVETLQIFLPGFLLLALLISIEMVTTERHTAVVRRDIFGGVDVFVNKRFFYFPFIFQIVARMPTYALRLKTSIEMIDTRTARLLPIEQVRVRSVYQITDYKTCLAQAANEVEQLRAIEATHGLRPTDPALWPQLLEKVLARYLDDQLRAIVWSWQRAVERFPSLMLDPLSRHLPRPPVPPSPPPPPPNLVLENDPYDLSLNRKKLAEVLRTFMAREASEWGITIKEVVLEHVKVSDDLISKRTRNKVGEVSEAEHQANLDSIAIRARGMAEADVRACTVKRILEELVAVKGLPAITEKTVAEIVRAAMYSDGEMIWKGVLEKSMPNAAGTSPGTAKTA